MKILVTFDSNDPQFSSILATSLSSHAFEWVNNDDRLNSLQNLSEEFLIFYNTPLAKADGWSQSVLEKFFVVCIVYLEKRYKDSALTTKLLTNIQSIPAEQVIVITEYPLDHSVTNQYVINRGSYCLNYTASVIASLILIHLQKESVVTQSELIEFLLDGLPASFKGSTDSADNNTVQTINVYDIVKAIDRKKYKEINNCQIFEMRD